MNLRDALAAIVRVCRKLVQVAETDYPAVCNGTWNPVPALSEPGVPISAAGQTEWVRKIIDIVRNVPMGLGRGVVSVGTC